MVCFSRVRPLPLSMMTSSSLHLICTLLALRLYVRTAISCMNKEATDKLNGSKQEYHFNVGVIERYRSSFCFVTLLRDLLFFRYISVPLTSFTARPMSPNRASSRGPQRFPIKQTHRGIAKPFNRIAINWSHCQCRIAYRHVHSVQKEEGGRL